MFSNTCSLIFLANWQKMIKSMGKLKSVIHFQHHLLLFWLDTEQNTTLWICILYNKEVSLLLSLSPQVFGLIYFSMFILRRSFYYFSPFTKKRVYQPKIQVCCWNDLKGLTPLVKSSFHNIEPYYSNLTCSKMISLSIVDH